MFPQTKHVEVIARLPVPEGRLYISPLLCIISRESETTSKGKEMPVRPKEAATVILLRQCPPEAGGFEVLMVLRHPKSRFVPRAYVFPGGVLDDEDASAAMEEHIEGIDRDGAFRILEDCPSPEIALGSWVAGIRETFEEVGILLAYEAPGQWFSHGEGPALERLCRKRRLLFEGKLSFSRFLREERLTLACDRLFIFPTGSRRSCSPCATTSASSSPRPRRASGLSRRGGTHPAHLDPSREGLSRFSEGAFDMVLPTLATMKELASWKTVDEVLAWAGRKTVQGFSHGWKRRTKASWNTCRRNGLPESSPLGGEDPSRKEN
jgi:8-oxo-dGTP pyrophosphatase MutT (NUDIX family)